MRKRSRRVRVVRTPQRARGSFSRHGRFDSRIRSENLARGKVATTSDRRLPTPSQDAEFPAGTAGERSDLLERVKGRVRPRVLVVRDVMTPELPAT